MQKSNRQQAQRRGEVVRLVFKKHFIKEVKEIPFTMDDIRWAIDEVSKKQPDYQEKNVADLRYQFTSGRSSLPSDIEALGPWMIRGKGKGAYAFVKLLKSPTIAIQPDLVVVVLPDATPEIVLEYAGSDEQGVLAKLRYNRMLDIFLGITCYHLQNHWRTTVANMGQCEIDDLYVGLNTHGNQFVIPIEAKGHRDRLSKTQVVQLVKFARERYPNLTVRPVGIQEMSDGTIVLVEFSPGGDPDGVKIKEIRRYKLAPISEVPPGQLRGNS